MWIVVALFAAAACSKDKKAQTIPESSLDETNQTTASEDSATTTDEFQTTNPQPDPSEQDFDAEVRGSDTATTPGAPGSDTIDDDLSGDITDDESIPSPSEGVYAGGRGGTTTGSRDPSRGTTTG